MATQVQIRGATQATQEARTLVSRELDINTTDGRLCVHNGSFSGGIRHVNMYDQQNSEFNYASTSGTNAITASMRVAPQSYTTGQVFWLKITNTITGSATLNINSLGAKTVKKVFNGALSNLSADDLISGQTVGVIYDGTYFQIVSGSGVSTGRQTFTPSGTGITNIEAYYADYGDSVTVHMTISTTQSSDFTVTNLPFSCEAGLAFSVDSGRSGTYSGEITVGRMAQGANTITITPYDSFTRRYSLSITYIKD